MEFGRFDCKFEILTSKYLAKSLIKSKNDVLVEIEPEQCWKGSASPHIMRRDHLIMRQLRMMPPPSCVA